MDYLDSFSTISLIRGAKLYSDGNIEQLTSSNTLVFNGIVTGDRGKNIK